MNNSDLTLMKKISNILFLLVVFFTAANAQDKSDKEKREIIDLANFLDARMIPGYNFESDLTFPYWKGEFPELEMNSPITARQYLGGDYSINIRWFDGNLQEVEKPHSPGRYAYYAEITGANGIVMRRSATLFCTPSEWQGWSEYLKADIAYFPFDSIPPNVWKNNKEPISAYAGQILLNSIINNEDGAILMSYIHDMYKGNIELGILHTPIIMDGDFHVKLKQKILGVENKYEKLALPQTVHGNGQTLQPLSKKENKSNAEFYQEINELCKKWAEKSGEPFDMLIAKDGKILFHDAFGENLRGTFTKEEPTEIASITKLYTGLLFAQFVDQRIISIDDYVGTFSPDFPIEGAKAITLRQCFTHTTGFWGHGSFGGVQNPWLDNSLALWLPHLDPGASHWYNGMGYNLAGKVMEIASGKSIFHLMQEQIFTPLELENTILDMDLAYGAKTTAYDMAVIGQLLLNKGTYGKKKYFSEKTYNAILPVNLEKYFPKIKDKEWGIGITSMNVFITDEKNGGKRAILSDKIIGHGSATSSILRVDPEHNIVITQSRMNKGKLYDEYLTNAMLLIEEFYSNTQ